MDIRNIIEECHTELLNTRGAALCIGKIHFKQNEMEYTSIGNIESRIYGKEQKRLISYDGIVGRSIKNYKVNRYPFRVGDCLISYTDGISNSFVLKKELITLSAQQIAHTLFSLYSKNNDDSTILVIK